MIVWGGAGPCCYSALNNGGRYNPITDRWTVVAISEAAPARKFHTAVWTGQEMVVWGGADGALQPVSGGARYAPAADRWLALATLDAPAPRVNHSAVWTGQEMIVWGGSSAGPLATGAVWRIHWLRSYLPNVARSN